MTIADDFIAECKGKSVEEIDHIEQGYFEDGLFDGNSGLYTPLHVSIIPATLSNGDLSFNFNGITLSGILNKDIAFNLATQAWRYITNNSVLDIFPGSQGMDDYGEIECYANWGEGLDGISGSFDIPVSPSIAQNIIDQLAPGTVVGEDEAVDWHITFDYFVENRLDTSNWEFNDGSTCNWFDLQ